MEKMSWSVKVLKVKSKMLVTDEIFMFGKVKTFNRR
jgi:hypothetical protein